MSNVENVTAFRTMVQHLSGVSESDIDAAVRECLQAINDRGGKAALTLKFTFSRHKNFQNVVGVKCEEPKISLPKEENIETLMFTDANNNLLIQPQEQGKLLLEETTPTRGNLREADVTPHPRMREVN